MQAEQSLYRDGATSVKAGDNVPLCLQDEAEALKQKLTKAKRQLLALKAKLGEATAAKEEAVAAREEALAQLAARVSIQQLALCSIAGCWPSRQHRAMQLTLQAV